MSDKESCVVQPAPPRSSSSTAEYLLCDEALNAAVRALPGTELYRLLREDLVRWSRPNHSWEEGKRFTRVIAKRMRPRDDAEVVERLAGELVLAMWSVVGDDNSPRRWIDDFVDGDYDAHGKSFEGCLRAIHRKDRQGGRDRNDDALRLASRRNGDFASHHRENGPEQSLLHKQEIERGLARLKHHRSFKPIHERMIEAIKRGEDHAGIARYIRRSPGSVTRLMNQIVSMLTPRQSLARMPNPVRRKPPR